MASISSLGLSGLPLSDLLANLRKVEEAPLQLLANRKASFETKISGYGALKSSLSSLQSSIKTLGETATFGALKTSVSNADALTANIPTDGGAVAGSYSIKVEQLATTQSLATAPQAKRDTPLGQGGTITFTLGDPDAEPVTLELNGEVTLESLRSAINKANLGFTATLVNNGDPATPEQLILSTTSTGRDARITAIQVSGNTELATVLDYTEPAPTEPPTTPPATPSGMYQTEQVARDAVLTVNGITITKGSNTITDAIEGVTLNLLTTTAADAPVTLKVEENTAVATSAIKAFVSAYNSLNSAISQLTSFDTASQSSSALTGDHVPRTVQTRLRSVLGSLAGEGGSIQMLSQLGITTNTDTGALNIDDAKLTKALADSKGDVMAFFTGEKGLAKKLATAVDDMLSSNGLIENATQGMKKSVDSVIKQAEAMTTRIDDTMARYQSQFVALEVLMSQMNSTSSYLSSQLSMLEASAKSSK